MVSIVIVVIVAVGAVVIIAVAAVVSTEWCFAFFILCIPLVLQMEITVHQRFYATTQMTMAR